MSEPIPLRAPRPRSDGSALAELVKRVSRGDEVAYAGLYDELVNTMYGIARRVVRDPSRAEEITQEAMVEIWQQAPRYDATKGSVRAWASMISHRRAVDVVRREESARRTEKLESARNAHREFDQVSETVVDRIDYAQVRKCLGTLTELQAEAVGLAYYRGLTYPEVASVLEVKLATVKTRMRDGLIRLRDCLGANA